MFSSKIGQGKFALAVYDKLERITVKFGDEHLLYVTVDVDSDHEKIINDLIKLEKKYFQYSTILQN